MKVNNLLLFDDYKTFELAINNLHINWNRHAIWILSNQMIPQSWFSMMHDNCDNMTFNYSKLLESKLVQFDFNSWSHFSLLTLSSLKKLRGSLPFILIESTFLLKLSLTSKFIFTLIALPVILGIQVSLIIWFSSCIFQLHFSPFIDVFIFLPL